jgi:hypothetical protein
MATFCFNSNGLPQSAQVSAAISAASKSYPQCRHTASTSWAGSIEPLDSVFGGFDNFIFYPHINIKNILPPGKIHPVLLLTFNELRAVQTAPPVALLSWIDRKLALTVPEAFDKVNCEPGLLLLMVIRFDALVPDKLKLETVCVVPAVKVTVLG